MRGATGRRWMSGESGNVARFLFRVSSCALRVSGQHVKLATRNSKRATRNNPMFTSETTVRVRYAETDQMGYVYYGHYAAYYEVARTDAFRALGLPYAAMEDAGVMLPVLDFHIRYHRPARYDDLLTIRLRMPALPTTSSIRFEYETVNEAGVVLNNGETTLVFASKATGRPVRIPEHIRQKLEPYFD